MQKRGISEKAKWEIALDKFVKKWANRKDVIGIIVCGSYITGNPTKHSDIDIRIILDEGVTWRERGNEVIDGILIEYFANPPEQEFYYLKKSHASRAALDAHMFLTGKVILDRKGIVKKLIKKAKEYQNKPYSAMKPSSCERVKYTLWDLYDNLEEVLEAKTQEFYFVYYNDLNELLEIYLEYLSYVKIRPHKVFRFLTSEKDKKKYLLKDFPDKVFVKMFVSALKLKNKNQMLKEYKKLNQYVLSKMGGFNIDGWKFRSPIEID